MQAPPSSFWWRWRIVTAVLLASALGAFAWLLWPRYVDEGDYVSPDQRHRLVLVLRLIGTSDEMTLFGCRPGQRWQDGVQLCGWVNGSIAPAWKDDAHAWAQVCDPSSLLWWKRAEWDGVKLVWEDER
jgi:hypothetical protein